MRVKKAAKNESGSFMGDGKYVVFSRTPYGKEWIREFDYDSLEEAEKEASRVSRNAHFSKVMDKTGKVVARFHDMFKESVRKDEILGGLIGKVNATEKDGKELAKFLSKKPMFREDGADITVTKNGFGVLMLTEYHGTLYAIVIDEDKNGSDKIRVSLFKEKNKVGSVSGLRLDHDKIYSAVLNLLKKEGIDIFALDKPSSDTSSTVSTWDIGQKKQVNILEKKLKDFDKLFKKYLKDLSVTYSPAIAKEIDKKRDEFWEVYLERDIEPEKYGKEYFKIHSRAGDKGIYINGTYYDMSTR